MKKSLIMVTMLVAGSAYADSAPVSRVSSGSLEERLDQLERVMDARNSAQMNLLNQVAVLQDEIADLRGVTEEHAYQLEQLLQRQRDIYQEMDRRLANQPSAGATPTINTTQVATNQSSSQSNSGSSATNYSSNLSENDAYDQAIRLVLEDKQYDQAIPAFKDFIERFPSSTYAPNAHYWLGQLLFADGEYEQAAEQFNTVVDDFPDSNKRGDCLLKLGTIAQQQDRSADARDFFNRVIQSYPDSTEAGLARQRLNDL